MTLPPNTQLGHIARHAPPNAGAQGREAAIVDVAQDLLLRDRSKGDFDIEDIGALSAPLPTADELSRALRTHYSFLADLDPDEQIVAAASGADRPLALRLLAELPGGV
ncbi:MAG: hypothetical protein LBO20_08285 [Bifidobacteriaceae bacterium]|jgi:hypothetical protein|nr:hypothetical protein [Bifidobacteriaceae bacterium]